MSAVKISKEEMNEILKEVFEDNRTYGLILKIVYVYGRNIGEVLKLQRDDVDLKHNTIDFRLSSETISFMLHDSVKYDLLEYIDDVDDSLFLKDVTDLKGLNKYSNNINRYLRDFIKSKNRRSEWDCPNLVCSDFRKLRVQHLFLDGADVKTINELLHIKSLQTVKKILDYDELMSMKFPCTSVNKIFHEFTDLNLFVDSFVLDSDFFSISVVGTDYDIIVEYNYNDDVVTIVGGDDMELLSKVKEIDDYALFHRMNRGCYRLVDGLKIVKI